ncbi:MAG: hypothetical protein AAGA15_13920 [Pseudomonadota bacterium]
MLTVLIVCGLAALIIGGEWLLGLDLEERDFNWRRGPQIRVAE